MNPGAIFAAGFWVGFTLGAVFVGAMAAAFA